MDNVQDWWDQLPRITQLGLQYIVIILGAIIFGNMVNTRVKTKLTAIGFAEYFRFPWLPAGQRRQQSSLTEEPAEKLTLPDLLGFICKATIWTIAVWLLATIHQAEALSAVIVKILGHVWTLGVVLLAAMIAAGWAAQRLYDFVHTIWNKSRSSSQLYEQSGLIIVSPEAVGFVLSFIIYGFFLLLALISITELLNLDTTANIILGIWRILVAILTALIAFGLCWLGLTLVRGHLVDISEAHEQESRADHYAGLGIVVGTTIIALGLLANTTTFFVSLAILLLLGFLLWPLRHYFLDLWAGIMLRSHQVRRITIDGETMSVASMGLLITTLTGQGQTLNRRNKDILTTLMTENTSHKNEEA